MGRVDDERRDPGAQPADGVLPLAAVVDGRSAAGRREESKLVQRHAVEKREEDLAQRAVRECVPELAPGGGRRAKRHLASGTPHRGRAWSSWCLHRQLSMVRSRVRIESNGSGTPWGGG